MSTQQEKFTEIAEAIREKTGTTDLIKPSDFAAKVGEVYEAGKQAEYDAFWDAHQESGNKVEYANSFYGSGWNDEVFKPKYSIKPTSISRAFYKCKITNLKKLLNDCGVELDLSGIQYSQISQSFAESAITDIGVLDVSSCTSLQYFLWRAASLINVDKVILSSDSKTGFDNTTFQNCSSLVEIRFEGVIGQNGFNMQWSKKLSHNSLMSIINALADKSEDTSGTEWIVTIGDTNIAKLTDEEIAVAENKGWVVK